MLASRIATREANGTVLVFRNGRQVYRRDIGMADFSRRRLIGPGTVFRLASISKTLTGGAATVLRVEGRLRLPVPVADYLPTFPHGREIQVFHLLAHSSGLGDVPDPPAGRPYTSLEQSVASFADMPLAFAPGSRSQYSNAGYVLAARLIELASGQGYDAFLRSRFFTPLHMTSARENRSDSPSGNRAALYLPGPGPNGVIPAVAPDLSSVIGAGALEMTAGDLMRWLEAVRSRRFFDIFAQEYPWGWGKRTYFGLDAIEQSGRNAGYTTSALIIPDRQLSVLCLFNTQSGFGLRCAATVAAALLDQPVPQAPLDLDLPRVPLADAAARALEGRFTGNGWNLRFARRHGGLFYSWTGNRWMPVVPATGNRFLLLTDSALVTAPRDGGRIDRIVYRDGAADVTLSRAAAPDGQAGGNR